ncbi:MAG: HAMP domain-containing histidine kinase [Clostridiales bacterium]|nr:HAMP domain-containing histidine kinase [Clostridiales bacterium]
MMKKRSFKLGFYFTLVVFAIMSASIVLIAPIMALTASRGYFAGMDIMASFVVLYLLSMATGVTISAIVGHKILKPILKFSSALKEVSAGNFQVQVPEDRRIEELSLMASNFNRMVQQLQNTETVHGDFIANLSHEFKTPLASIEGYAMLLKDQRLSREEHDEYVSRILHATHRLSNLSGNILKISRLESQEIITDKKQYRLDEQLRQAVLLLEEDWSRKNLEMDVRLQDVIYYGNDELLMQVWLNLLSNAIKFTPPGGTITVELTKTDTVKAVVRDTGIGIDKDSIEHIFEKFYQGDTSRKSEGNGLGLAIVSRIVKLCAGTISVEAAPGEGSVFTVSLPL